jgi:virginiamycin A acetyltransferase
MSNLTKEQIEHYAGRGFLATGSHAKLVGEVAFEPPVTAHDCVILGPSHIGRYTEIGDFAHIAPHSRIGRYCSLATGCAIGASEPPLDWLSSHGFQHGGLAGAQVATRPWPETATRLGHDVRVGAHAVILAGVTIGDGAVIAPGAVVTTDVPPYGIVTGNPAKAAKTRFAKKLVAELLALAWWDLPAAEIQDLPFDDIAQCLALLREIRRRLPVSPG